MRSVFLALRTKATCVQFPAVARLEADLLLLEYRFHIVTPGIIMVYGSMARLSIRRCRADRAIIGHQKVSRVLSTRLDSLRTINCTYSASQAVASTSRKSRSSVQTARGVSWRSPRLHLQLRAYQVHPAQLQVVRQRRHRHFPEATKYSCAYTLLAVWSDRRISPFAARWAPNVT
jgi:hypothetical protein